MNFTRTVLAEVGRALTERGVATWLPDLPGTGESERPLSSVSWEDWRDAARAAGAAVEATTGAVPLTCAFRGGALLDDAVAAAGRWRYAPASGEALLRQLRRAQFVTDREAGVARGEDGEIVELAGYPLSARLRDGLAAAEPAAVEHRAMPPVPDGSPWRRAEPSGNRPLAERLADDIAVWAIACAS